MGMSISGRVDRAIAPETADLGSITGRVKPKAILQLFYLMFSYTKETVCTVRLIRTPLGPFAVS